MNDIKQCLHVMGDNQTLQIDFAGDDGQAGKEIKPEQLKDALHQMKPGETLIVRFDHEES